MAKIGKRASAKKYAELRKLQARVNRMLYKSTHIEKSNGKRKQVLAMKRQFYKSRGIKNPSHLSFSVLSSKDIKAYTELLKSIENNTFINPEKYKQYQQKMKYRFDEQGYEFDYEEIDEILDNEIIDELLHAGLTPSDFWAVYDEYTRGNKDKDRAEIFIESMRSFYEDYNAGDVTLDDFFVYTDAYIERRTGNGITDILFE